MTSGCSSSRQATRSTSPATSSLYLAYISPASRLYLPQASNEEYLPCQQRLYCHGREIPADVDSVASLGEVGDMGRYGEIWGGMGRYGEVWGGMGRYGEIWLQGGPDLELVDLDILDGQVLLVRVRGKGLG